MSAVQVLEYFPGYGDMAAETIGGRIFTMFYAIFGIPLLVIVLTDWGSLLFDFAQLLWLKSWKGFVIWLRSFMHAKKFDNTVMDKLQLVVFFEFFEFF